MGDIRKIPDISEILNRRDLPNIMVVNCSVHLRPIDEE